MAGRRPPDMLDSPGLDARLAVGGGSNLLDDGDESGFLQINAREMDKLNLVDTPPVSRGKEKATTYFSSPSKMKKRPSWGPKSSPTKGKIRLLEGIDKAGPSQPPPEIRRKERTLGGLGQDKAGSLKARQSIFAKPAYVNLQQQNSQDLDADPDAAEESFYKDPALASSTGSVHSKVTAIEATRAQGHSPNGLKTNGNGNGSSSESKEQLDAQLKELKKMNDVFEAYETMLNGSADQIENFAQRIAETNSLLDIYIDLMRQADRTQQLLQDADWKGASEDEAAHALALELAERERRRREQEAEHAALIAAQRKREAEQARLESQQAEQRKSSLSSSRGARGGTSTRGGGMTASVRGRGLSSSRTPSIAARGKVPTPSTRGAPSAARGGENTASSTSSGLNNKYASVRSSGYGPPK